MTTTTAKSPSTGYQPPRRIQPPRYMFLRLTRYPAALGVSVSRVHSSGHLGCRSLFHSAHPCAERPNVKEDVAEEPLVFFDHVLPTIAKIRTSGEYIYTMHIHVHIHTEAYAAMQTQNVHACTEIHRHRQRAHARTVLIRPGSRE